MVDKSVAFASDLDVVAEQTYKNRKSIERSNTQRRDEFVDLYGIEYHRNGSNGKPATFHVSVSGDAAYIERFEFKIVIEPFQMLVSPTVSPTSLSIDIDVDGHTAIFNDSVTPNPHTHNISAGITDVPVTADDFRIECEGIDITPYLKAQCEEGGMEWISGEGVFPSTDVEQSFDLIEVACDMKAEGNDDDADKILRQGWKPIKLISESAFSATMVLYLKYQHMNR